MRFKSGRVTGIRRHLVGVDNSAKLLAILQSAGWPVAPGHPIPPTADFRTVVNGVAIHVRAKSRRGMEKRVFAQCPECARWVEAGHLHQHTEAAHP